MKKLVLLFSIFILWASFSYAQGISANPSTVTSGESVTFTASGESQIGYYIIINSVKVSGSTSVTISQDGPITFFNKTSLTPTTFKYKFTSTSTQSVNVTVTVSGTVNNDLNGTQNNDYRSSFIITVKPKVTTTTYSNDALSATFYNNTCATGYGSDPYVYQVAANAYTSTISKADANSKAQADINANGQRLANANRPCKVLYYNDVQSKVFTKNTCGTGSNGSQVTYTVAARQYSSSISVQDANSKAINDINTKGQAYANTNGTCSAVTYARIEVINKVTTRTAIPGERGFYQETWATLQVKLYSDAAGTQPLLATTPMAIVVSANQKGTYTSGEGFNTTWTLNYSIPPGTSTFVIGKELIKNYESNVNGPGSGTSQWEKTYSVVANGNTYVPIPTSTL